jgi:hypothetical protein
MKVLAMNGKIRIETQAFEVEDEDGLRTILIRTRPVSVDEHGNATPLPMGGEFRLRNGQSVAPISDAEFIGARGKRWHRIDQRAP